MREKQELLYKFIISEIRNNSSVTEKYLSEKYMVSERTIRRYIKDLKNRGIIILEINKKNRKWKIL